MKFKHWTIFILLGLIWSTSFLWIKIGIREISPSALVAFRMLFGAMTAGAVALYQKVEWPRDWKTWSALAILGPTSLAIPIFFISFGEQSVDSAVASILNATVPLFTLVIAHFWLHDDKMTIPKAVGLLIGFAGVILILSRDLSASTASSVLGEGAVILAAIFYAGSAVYARKATKHISGMARSAAPLITASLFMWIAVPFTDASVHLPVLALTWIAILWLGILGSGIAMIMFYYLIHEVGPTRASLVTYLFPIGGIAFGAIFLGEHLSWQLFAGATLIISSLAVVNRKPAPAFEEKK